MKKQTTVGHMESNACQISSGKTNSNISTEEGKNPTGFIRGSVNSMKTKNPYVITFDGRKVNVDSIYYFQYGDMLARTNIGRENEEEFRVKGQHKDATLYRGKDHYNTIKESRDYRKDQARFFEEEMKKSWKEQGENYKDNELNKGMVNTACKHMQKDALAIEHLLCILNEVEVLVNEGISKEKILGVIKNGKERHHLDTMIFTEKLFQNPRGFSIKQITNG